MTGNAPDYGRPMEPWATIPQATLLELCEVETGVTLRAKTPIGEILVWAPRITAPSDLRVGESISILALADQSLSIRRQHGA